VFLHGIVTAAIAVEEGDCRSVIQILGGENVVVSDLTIVSDGCDGIRFSDTVKKLKIDNIISKKPIDWPKRQ
jgi:hypothetical protein